MLLICLNLQTMSKGSRFSEKFWHDIPHYPFSKTPDGRTVGELNRIRKAGESFQKRSLELQERTVKELVRSHGNTQVVKPQDVRTDEVVSAFGRMTAELQSLHTASDQTSRSIDSLASTAEQGFDGIQTTLNSINGPQPKQELLEEILEEETDIVAALGMHREGTLNLAGIQQLQGIIERPLRFRKAQARKEIAHLTSEIWQSGSDFTHIESVETAMQFLGSTENVLMNPSAAAMHVRTLNGFARKYQVHSVLEFTQQIRLLLELYAGSGSAAISEKALVKMANSGLLSDEMANAVMEQFPEARRRPSLASINFQLADILRKNTAMEKQGGVAIEQRQEQINNQIVAHAQRGLLVSQNAQVIRQGQTAISQRSRLIEQGEVRIGQGFIMIEQLRRMLKLEDEAVAHLDSLNYNVEELIDRSDIANELSAESLYNLRQIVAHLVKSQVQGVNFKEIVSYYMQQVISLLNYHGGVTRQLTTEIVSAKLSIVLQVRRLEEGLKEEVEKVGDELQRVSSQLGRLISLTENEHTNIAHQYYQDGKQCLETAENETDIHDAYQAFCRGLEIVSASAENHFGAGMTAKMLGKAKKAREHLDKAGRRAGEEQFELASKAYEEKAKIEYEEGIQEGAQKSIQKAIQKDPANISAHYLSLKFDIEAGNIGEIVGKTVELTKLDESAYSHLSLEPFFISLERRIKKKIVREVWGQCSIRRPTAMVHIFEEMMKYSMEEASEVFQRLLLVHPHILVQKEIWRHPGFKAFFDILQKITNEFIRKSLPQHDEEHKKRVYQLAYLCGFINFE